MTSIDFPEMFIRNSQRLISSLKPFTAEFDQASSLDKATFDCSCDQWCTVAWSRRSAASAAKERQVLTSTVQSVSVQMCMV